MITLLKTKYAPHYHSTRTNIIVVYTNYSTDFFLSDQKSCNQPTDTDKCHHCNKHILEIRTTTNMCCIAIEQFIKQFGENTNAGKGSCCDQLLLDEHNKIVFIELSCSCEKYIKNFEQNGIIKDGKRAKAYSQLENTVNKLFSVPEIQTKIKSYAEKYCLFAWRDSTDAMNTEDVAIKSIRPFLKMSYMLNNSNLQTKMQNGFMFIENKYPSIYQWNLS